MKKIIVGFIALFLIIYIGHEMLDAFSQNIVDSLDTTIIEPAFNPKVDK